MENIEGSQKLGKKSEDKESEEKMILSNISQLNFLLNSDTLRAEFIDISGYKWLNKSEKILRKDRRKAQSELAHQRLDRLQQEKGTKEVSFSLSHSGRYIFVALSDVGKIGVDIEEIKREKSRETLLTEVERKLIKYKNCSFTLIWTLREAAFKALYPHNKCIKEISILAIEDHKLWIKYRDGHDIWWEKFGFYISDYFGKYIFSVVIFHK